MISLSTLLVVLVATLSTAAPLPDDPQTPSIIFKRVNPIPPSVTCGPPVNPPDQTDTHRVYQRDEIAAGMSAIDNYKNGLPDPSQPPNSRGTYKPQYKNGIEVPYPYYPGYRVQNVPVSPQVDAMLNRIPECAQTPTKPNRVWLTYPLMN